MFYFIRGMLIGTCIALAINIIFANDAEAAGRKVAPVKIPDAECTNQDLAYLNGGVKAAVQLLRLNEKVLKKLYEYEAEHDTLLDTLLDRIERGEEVSREEELVQLKRLGYIEGRIAQAEQNKQLAEMAIKQGAATLAECFKRASAWKKYRQEQREVGEWVI